MASLKDPQNMFMLCLIISFTKRIGSPFIIIFLLVSYAHISTNIARFVAFICSVTASEFYSIVDNKYSFVRIILRTGETLRHGKKKKRVMR